MRESVPVDHQATLDVSKSGVPVVKVDKRLVVAGLINHDRRCFSDLSESTPPRPPPSCYFDRGEKGRKREFFSRCRYVDQRN